MNTYLTTVNDLKTEVRNNFDIPPAMRAAILTRPMPKFLWRATALANQTPILDVIFDATDFPNGNIYVCAIDYEQDIAEAIRISLKSMLDTTEFLIPSNRRLYEWYSSFNIYNDDTI